MKRVDRRTRFFREEEWEVDLAEGKGIRGENDGEWRFTFGRLHSWKQMRWKPANILSIYAGFRERVLVFFSELRLFDRTELLW